MAITFPAEGTVVTVFGVDFLIPLNRIPIILAMFWSSDFWVSVKISCTNFTTFVFLSYHIFINFSGVATKTFTLIANSKVTQPLLNHSNRMCKLTVNFIELDFDFHNGFVLESNVFNDYEIVHIHYFTQTW